MKTELIEYHREFLRGIAIAELSSDNDTEEMRKRDKAFHERAVAWLESLKTIEELSQGPIFADEPQTLTPTGPPD